MLQVATQDTEAVTSAPTPALAPALARHPLPQPQVPSITYIKETAFHMCREFLHGAWRNVNLSDLVIRKISGGLSNLLYCCELPENVAVDTEPRRVLVRFYGLVNRERALETLITECVILTLLSERHRGPRLYGVFPGGRLEEYVNARPLLTQELSHPTISCVVAVKLATIHLMDVPMTKTPNRVWESMEKWVESIEKLIDQEPDSAEQDAMIVKLRSLDVRAELYWLRKFMENVSSPVVFCHNDMQEGNILLRTPEPCLDKVTAEDLVIIDFEYCCYNRRGFDLANHFLEWMTDYKNESHPYFFATPEKDHATIEQKEMFVSAYLATLEESSSYKPQPEDTLQNILREIEFYTLAAHFHWALWSVVSNSSIMNRAIEFDYWCYGENRLEGYYAQKRKLLEVATP